MFCITKSPLVWAVLSLRFRGSRRVAVARRLHSKVSSLPILSGWRSPGGGRTVGGMGWATGEVGGNHSACPSADCLPGGIGKKQGGERWEKADGPPNLDVESGSTRARAGGEDGVEKLLHPPPPSFSSRGSARGRTVFFL